MSLSWFFAVYEVFINTKHCSSVFFFKNLEPSQASFDKRGDWSSAGSPVRRLYCLSLFRIHKHVLAVFCFGVGTKWFNVEVICGRSQFACCQRVSLESFFFHTAVRLLDFTVGWCLPSDKSRRGGVKPIKMQKSLFRSSCQTLKSISYYTRRSAVVEYSPGASLPWGPIVPLRQWTDSWDSYLCSQTSPQITLPPLPALESRVDEMLNQVLILLKDAHTRLGITAELSCFFMSTLGNRLFLYFTGSHFMPP